MSRRASLLVAAAVAVANLCLVSRGWAAEWPGDRDRALPCRPTIACTADIVPPGTFEVEAGALFRRGPRGRTWTFPLLLKQTLTQTVQLQAGSNGYTIVSGDAPAQYFDDVVFGPKVHFYDQSRVLPSLSVSAEASVPTLRREGYLRTYDALFTAYVTKDLGPVHADLNLGLNLWRIEKDPLVQEFAALALSMNLPPPFGIMVEGYVFSDSAPVAPRDGGFLFAVSHSPRPWLIFDAGGDIGFFAATRAYSLFVGMTVIPAVFWR